MIIAKQNVKLFPIVTILPTSVKWLLLEVLHVSLINRHFQNLIHAKSQKNNFSNL